MSHGWYVRQHAGEAGPYSWDELRYLARRHKLPPDQQVRRSDSAEWIAAVSVVGLFSPPVAASTALATTAPPAAAPKQTTLAPPAIQNSRSTAPPNLPPLLPKTSRRRWIAAAIGGTALLAALLLTVLLFSLPRAIVGQGDHQSAGPTSGSGEGAGKGTGSGDEAGEGAGDDKHEAATSAHGEPIGEIVAEGRGDEPENADEPASPAGSPATSSPPAAATPAAPSTTDGQGSSSSAAIRVRPPRTAAVIRPLEDDLSAVAAGNGSGTSSGPSSQFFQIRAKGRSFVYIVDCSSSMSGEPFEKACQELIASIKALKSNQRFFVIFFSNDAYPQFFPRVDRRLLPANAANKQRVTRWVEGFTASGGTQPLDAIFQGLSLEPDAMYLLSDGEFDPQIADELRQRNGGRIPVHTIAFMDLVAEPLLEQIARENNGVFRFVP